MPSCLPSCNTAPRTEAGAHLLRGLTPSPAPRTVHRWKSPLGSAPTTLQAPLGLLLFQFLSLSFLWGDYCVSWDQSPGPQRTSAPASALVTHDSEGNVPGLSACSWRVLYFMIP